MPRRSNFRPGFYLSSQTVTDTEELVPKGPNPPNVSAPNTVPTINPLYATNLSLTSQLNPNIKSIDLNKLRELLNSLRPLADTPLNVLPPVARENFRQVDMYIKILYDTEYYPIVYDEASKIFDLKQVTPGTVGAYFAGQRLARSQNVSGLKESLDLTCLPISSNSMPLPKSHRPASSCSYTVVLGKRNASGKLDFLILSKASGSRALVFLPLVNGLAAAPLTQVERTQLAQLGLSEVKVIGYAGSPRPDGKDYIDLTTWVPVQSLPANGASITPLQSIQRQMGTPVNTTTILIAIIIIILILVAIWWLSTRS